MSPQFPEMYSPTAMASQQADILPHNDASAQQSQQAPTVQLLNSTRASERWDGKSKLEKLLEPIVNGIRSYLDPIASVFYSMPATFRGLNSDVTTMKTTEEEKKQREILVPQPRFIAQRKMNYRKAYRPRPKKYTELNLDLDKLKKNKDLHDYLKTKKYKFNYQNTYYYPRVKYFVNPNTFFIKPKNTRLAPHRKEINPNISTPKSNVTLINLGHWKPVILVPVLTNQSTLHNTSNVGTDNMYMNLDNIRRTRAKRSVDDNSIDDLPVAKDLKDYDLSISGRSIIAFMQALSNQDPVKGMWKHANIYTKKIIKHSLKSIGPPAYYSITYDIIMMTLDVIDGLIEVQQDLTEHFFGGKSKKPKVHGHPPKQKPSKKKKKKKKPHGQHQHMQQLQQQQQQQQQQQLQNIRDEEDLFDLLGKKE